MVESSFSVNMYYTQPILLDKSNIENANFCQFSNVVSDGSPSRMCMVRRISLGMTTRPRSSMRRTIPVAFICKNLLCFYPLTGLVFAGAFLLCGQRCVNQNPSLRRGSPAWFCNRYLCSRPQNILANRRDLLDFSPSLCYIYATRNFCVLPQINREV